jgi:cell division septum initiation protein DivIVA
MAEQSPNQNPDLRESLARLNAEMESAPHDDEGVRGLLDDVRHGLQRVVDQVTSDDPNDDVHSLRERMNEAVMRLEASNPGIASAINAALNILSNAGV